MRIFILNRGKDNILLASPCSVVYLYILGDIISYYEYNDIYVINKIRNRIIYNITHSNIPDFNKNKLLIRLEK